jgi:hypothetical protein
MSTEKWLNTAVGICLVVILAVAVVYAPYKSGDNEYVIPVTGEEEIPFTLCCSRVHEKVHPVTQSLQSETNESASPNVP